VSALARRAVACPGWRRMSGMLTDVGERVTDPTVCYLGTLPDLTDPLTVQAVLLLVREAWMCPQVSVRYEMGRVWRVRHQDGALLGEGATEAEALIDALDMPTMPFGRAAGGEE
jgi:hypothetical protein